MKSQISTAQYLGANVGAVILTQSKTSDISLGSWRFKISQNRLFENRGVNWESTIVLKINKEEASKLMDAILGVVYGGYIAAGVRLEDDVVDETTETMYVNCFVQI